MKKIYFFLCMLVCSTGVWAQAAGDYRSFATGNWNAIGTWETYNGSDWIPAVATPTSTNGVITIRSPHVVTISANGLSYDQVVVDAGGQVTVAATVTTTMANGTGTDLTINGTWLHSGGTWTVTGAAWTVGAGGTYIHNTTSAAAAPLAVATLDPASNLIYRGSSTLATSVSFSGRTFGNLSFESTSGNWTPSVVSGSTNTSCTNFLVGTGVLLTGITYTGIFTVNGNFTNNGTITYGTGTQVITFTGVGKTISGAGAISFETFNVNNGASITANNNVTIANLNFNSGTLALGANNLTISGTVSGGSSTSYIKTNGFGTVTVNNIGAETLVPLGNAKYNPVTIQNGSGHNWVVRVEDGLTTDPGFPSDKAVLVTWNITPSVNPPAGPANIVFQFDEATQAGPNFSLAENVQAWYRIASWHATGSPVAAVGIAGEKKVTVNGLTHFSPYAISNVSGPLPISINYFNGIKQGNDHLLNWKLNSNSSATIILERSSDGRNYKEIYSINATAQRCQQPFEYTNAQPLAGINYYRLKMTDASGKMSYSNTVALLNEQSGFELVSIAPNPVQSDGRAILNVTAAEAGTLQIIVTDMNGSKIMTQNETLQAGSKQVVMNLSRLTTGTYQVTAFYSDGTQKTLRLVKQ